jgi:putative toxin-antitoxin system antitoxin component (TIGR02293 family)
MSTRFEETVQRAVESPETVRQQIRSGLPIKWLEQLAPFFGVSVTAFADIVGIDSRTLSRRRKEGRLTHRESNALYHLAVLYQHALAVLGDTESVRHWFNTEEDDFSGMKPIELLDTASGVKEVDQLLGRIEHGVF